MHRYDVEKMNPEHYQKVKEEQDNIRKQCMGLTTMVRVCPYCKHKIDEIAQGNHGYTFTKCEKCTKSIVLPPVSFRRA